MNETKVAQRYCKDCGHATSVIVNVIKIKNASGEVHSEDEVSMTCTAGHHTTLGV